jgi:hypothetical protein
MRSMTGGDFDFNPQKAGYPTLPSPLAGREELVSLHRNENFNSTAVQSQLAYAKTC